MNAAQKILLCTDERIDGDTTGSTLAMFYYLRTLGKEAVVFSPKTWGEPHRLLPGFEIVSFDPAIFKQPADLIIIFDCSDGRYIQEFLPSLSSKFPISNLIVFDHHATNPEYGILNVIDTTASSTGEIVWRFLKSQSAMITKEMATCLLVAICTDTTLFTNSGTNPICLQSAADLIRSGARLREIVKTHFYNRSSSVLQLWGLAMERLCELPSGLLYTCVTRRDLEMFAVGQEEMEGLSNTIMGMVQGSEIVCVLMERDDNSVKGSLRTITGDVSLIAKRLGGGGHVKAAGFTVPGTALDHQGECWQVVWPDGTVKTVEALLAS